MPATRPPRPPSDAAADAALKQGFAAVPSASPKDAMRDILDTRAAAMRLPFGLGL